MSERWRAVRGFEGFYEVSDQGCVRSLDRETNRGSRGFGTVRGKVLKPFLSTFGYEIVNLVVNAISKREHIHALVARAFVEGEAPGLDVCHNDGDKLNNSAANLRWDTRSSNILDSVEHGTHAQAAKTHCPQGHPYSPANTYSPPTGPKARYCRACLRARDAGIDPATVVVEDEGLAA